jgi:hypothetical protein
LSSAGIGVFGVVAAEREREREKREREFES